ncbi:MAG: DUF411 domain-containing protein [Gammaproteobacteria bacterium]
MALFTRYLSILVLGCASTLAFAKPSPSTSVVYAMPHCDCCDGYVKYLQQHGFHVTEAITPHLADLAKQDGVPLKYREQPMGMTTGICHITKIGGYTVVGHVPAGVIHRVLKERPHIVGVILPGMPAGAPGMNGEKTGPLVVYAFDASGKIWVYSKD